MNTELKQLIEDAAKAQAEKQEPFPFSADRVTYHKTAAIGAIMPCGTMVTNVKEAYEAGQKAQAEKQEPVKDEPVAWCVAYDDPRMGRIHSNPSMYKPELEALISRAGSPLALVPLYTHPQPDLTAEVERLGAERDRFYMGYRMKCDLETKQQAERIAELESEVDHLYQVCRDAYEVWAGSNGIPEPITCVEAYLLQLLIAMRDEVKRGLK